MSGASNRKRGHAAELAVCAWLREHGYPEARSSRSVLGHDGTRQPGDIVGVPGWCVSVKDVARSSWPSWRGEAREEANGGPWVVVRRLRGNPDVAAWPCHFDAGDGIVCSDDPFGDLIESLTDGEP